jgi:hypothetical protein
VIAACAASKPEACSGRAVSTNTTYGLAKRRIEDLFVPRCERRDEWLPLHVNGIMLVDDERRAHTPPRRRASRATCSIACCRGACSAPRSRYRDRRRGADTPRAPRTPPQSRQLVPQRHPWCHGFLPARECIEPADGLSGANVGAAFPSLAAQIAALIRTGRRRCCGYCRCRRRDAFRELNRNV